MIICEKSHLIVSEILINLFNDKKNGIMTIFIKLLNEIDLIQDPAKVIKNEWTIPSLSSVL